MEMVCYLIGCEGNTNINITRLPTLLNHYPAETRFVDGMNDIQYDRRSAQNMVHYMQEMHNNTFGHFGRYPWFQRQIHDYADYGPVDNLLHYGRTTPPPSPSTS